MNWIGKKIKEVRVKRGLSQEELAEASKMNLRTIQRIESNESTPRGKTLKLIYDALDIAVIETDKKPINKYLIWSSFLTMMLIVGSLVGFFRYTIGYDRYGERIYRTLTGWSGSIYFGEGTVHNWLLSISTLSIAAVVICNSLNLIQNKMNYVLLQILLILYYLYTLKLYSHTKYFEIAPGLFITLVATVLLMITYRKKGRTTDVNITKN